MCGDYTLDSGEREEDSYERGGPGPGNDLKTPLYSFGELLAQCYSTQRTFVMCPVGKYYSNRRSRGYTYGPRRRGPLRR